MTNSKNYDRIFPFALAISIAVHLLALLLFPQHRFLGNDRQFLTLRLTLEKLLKLSQAQSQYYGGENKQRVVQLLQITERSEPEVKEPIPTKKPRPQDEFVKEQIMPVLPPASATSIPSFQDSLTILLALSPLIVDEDGTLTLKAWQVLSDYLIDNPTVLETFLQQLVTTGKEQRKTLMDRIFEKIPIPLVPYESRDARFAREAWEQIQLQELRREREKRLKQKNQADE